MRGPQTRNLKLVEGYKVELEAVRGWVVPLITLDQFMQQNRDKFVIG